MKTLVKSLLAVLTILTVVSCSKEVSRETGADVVTGSNFTATINGESWKADSLEQVIVSDSVVTITGLSKNLQEVSMVLSNFAIGKFSLNASTAGYGLYTQLSATSTDVYLTNSSVELAKASGMVEITAIDTLNKTVTGTFSFTGYRASDQTTVSVTTGVFNALAYSRTGSGTGGGVDSTIADNGRDTLSAYIDGTLFVADPTTISGTTSDFGNGPIVLLIGTRSAQDPEGFTLNFPLDLSPGTHALSYTGTSQVLYLANASDYYVPNGTDGVVKILINDQVNKRITGQFSFVGGLVPTFSPTKKITGAYFAITYQ